MVRGVFLFTKTRLPHDFVVVGPLFYFVGYVTITRKGNWISHHHAIKYHTTTPFNKETNQHRHSKFYSVITINQPPLHLDSVKIYLKMIKRWGGFWTFLLLFNI